MVVRAGNQNAAKLARDGSAGPWQKWRGSRVGRFIRFTEKYFRSPKKENSGEPIVLMPWQKEFVEAFYADEINEAVLGMGRGGAKSTTLAALAMFDLFDSDDQGAPSVPIVAVSLQQAKDAIYSQIVFAIESEPELQDRTIVYRGIGTERIEYPRFGGSLFPKAADPKTLQGLNLWPGGYLDEIGHIQPESWNAFKMGRKRPGARVLGAGTWGPDVNSPLYQLRRIVEEGAAPDSFLWVMYSGAPGASIMDTANWHKANPSLAFGLPAMEFMIADAVGTPEALFRTFRLNEPDVVGHDSWLGSDANNVWSALTDHYELVPGAPTFVGVDIGRTRDCTAVVACQRRPDGRLHAVARIWAPLMGLIVDLAEVSRYILDLTHAYDVASVSYDPRFFELEAIRLQQSSVPMVEVPQSMEHMTPIVSELRALIFAKGLSHEADEQFGHHVVNAVPQLNERGYTLSKSKSGQRGHIDACIALALAVDQFNHKPLPQQRLFVG